MQHSQGTKCDGVRRMCHWQLAHTLCQKGSWPTYTTMIQRGNWGRGRTCVTRCPSNNPWNKERCSRVAKGAQCRRPSFVQGSGDEVPDDSCGHTPKCRNTAREVAKGAPGNGSGGAVSRRSGRPWKTGSRPLFPQRRGRSHSTTRRSTCPPAVRNLLSEHSDRASARS